jgi:hypothetical protein
MLAESSTIALELPVLPVHWSSSAVEQRLGAVVLQGSGGCIPEQPDRCSSEHQVQLRRGHRAHRDQSPQLASWPPAPTNLSHAGNE